MRRYRGFIADSSRWQRFTLRDDDVIVSTPSKCGTTWMQNIVAMLIHGTTDLPAPISVLCPWLDMLTHTEEELVALLEAQQWRRSIKTHTALDGLPDHPTVTYITVFRHPLDAALSNRDHHLNTELERAVALRSEAVGLDDLDGIQIPSPPEDPADFLRWWIQDTGEPQGGGLDNLADYANSLREAWARRDRPNVHLFHYADLEADLRREMARVADILGVTVPDETWPAFVDAASFASMKARAAQTAPEAHTGLWRADEDFFRSGGRREWPDLLSATDVSSFEDRLRSLVGDAAASWALAGRG